MTRHASRLHIAVAQATSVACDIAANVAIHQSFVDAAMGVDLLVFPELSLVGYELGSGQMPVISASDPRLAPLQASAGQTGMTIVAGALLDIGAARPAIGAIIFLPSGARLIHTKQYLHAGEERRVTPGAGGATLAIGDDTVALAICADTSNPVHAAAAAAAGATVYACSMLISDAGYAADTAQLQRYAARYACAVAMANHGGATGGWVSAGRSAIWAPDGSLVVAAPGAGDVLVTAAREAGRWHGEVREIAAAG